ncbi:alcohol dehydrogenase catalytic domain-containing protein [Methylocucumis oryzae]|uniref:alcohol dehydrogenase catalytic domain-containing protein n=1 Tax=Methylocucumis oryzae TaxID=1632867 RepID=UPI000A85342A
MKAILMTEVGAPETLSYAEIAVPEITQTTEIKVQIKAAGVNPVDTKIRRNGLLYPLPLPAILGCDGAGVITEIGSAVTQFKPGDHVLVLSWWLRSRAG